MKPGSSRNLYRITMALCLVAILVMLTSKSASNRQKTGGYIFIDSGRMILDEMNLAQLDTRLLYLAKNEIYARHGYIFREKPLQNYFKTRAWYRPQFFWVGNLTSIEKKNIQSFQKYIGQQKQSLKHEVRETGSGTAGALAIFDLDGNNEMDEIRYTIVGNYRSDFQLQVNQTVIQGAGEALKSEFRIVDLDIYDNFKEIAIEQYGLSRTVTLFYCYDGQSIRFIGKINGLCGNYRRSDGAGKVWAEKRSDLLHHWPLKEEYRINGRHQLERSVNSYFATDGAVELTVKKAFTLYRKRNGDQTAFRVKPGERARLLGTDNCHWCLLANGRGQKGWFAVDNSTIIRELGLDAREVFAGLEQ
jgi:hypothetical protein